MAVYIRPVAVYSVFVSYCVVSVIIMHSYRIYGRSIYYTACIIVGLSLHIDSRRPYTAMYAGSGSCMKNGEQSSMEKVRPSPCLCVRLSVPVHL